MKIENSLPQPKCCDVCGSENIILTTNDVIYGRLCGNWPYVYYCADCTSSVGCHPGTHIPLGMMATRETRRLRLLAHKSFDVIWKSGYMTRQRAYNWLAEKLSIDQSVSHISWLSEQQLKETIRICDGFEKSKFGIEERRRAKKNVKQREREAREKRAYEWKKR